MVNLTDEELIQELANRFQVSVFLGIKMKDGRDYLTFKYKGGHFQVIGILEAVKAEMIARPLGEINDPG